MEAVELEGTTHGLQLTNEARHRPQRGVGGLVGAPAAELVIEDPTAAIRQLPIWVDVVVRHPRPTVQAEQRHSALTHAAVPNAASWDFDHALTDPDGHGHQSFLRGGSHGSSGADDAVGTLFGRPFPQGPNTRSATPKSRRPHRYRKSHPARSQERDLLGPRADPQLLVNVAAFTAS